MKLSIVTTLYKSAPYVEEFHRRASGAAQRITDDYEIVMVDDGSKDGTRELMREQIESDTCDVNSRHHQAVGKVADDFVASAHSPDGVVEAIERPASTFCVGVQWHPENFWRTGEFAGLFEAFVDAAAKRHR